jgi:hypothetical protein
MNHAADQWPTALFTLLLAIIIVVRVVTAQRGTIPFIRRIPGLNAVDDAIGRATEMGRPVMMVPGVGSIGDSQQTVPTLQALSILGYIARAVAGFGNRVIVATLDPVVTGVAEEVMREAYAAAGRPELFHPDDIRFLGGQQFAFASGVAGILSRERIAASFLFGSFYAESLILAEVGQRVGAIQIAGTEQRTQIPFFVAACDYVIIGDEFYAASAYLSRNPTLLGSIVGQDYCKILLISAVILGVLAASLIGYAHPGVIDIYWPSQAAFALREQIRYPALPAGFVHLLQIVKSALGG